MRPEVCRMLLLTQMWPEESDRFSQVLCFPHCKRGLYSLSEIDSRCLFCPSGAMGAKNCPYFSLFLPPNTHKTYGHPGDLPTPKVQQELSKHQKGPTHRPRRICRGQLTSVERPPSIRIAQRATIYQALTMCQAYSSFS